MATTVLTAEPLLVFEFEDAPSAPPSLHLELAAGLAPPPAPPEPEVLQEEPDHAELDEPFLEDGEIEREKAAADSEGEGKRNKKKAVCSTRPRQNSIEGALAGVGGPDYLRSFGFGDFTEALLRQAPLAGAGLGGISLLAPAMAATGWAVMPLEDGGDGFAATAERVFAQARGPIGSGGPAPDALHFDFAVNLPPVALPSLDAGLASLWVPSPAAWTAVDAPIILQAAPGPIVAAAREQPALQAGQAAEAAHSAAVAESAKAVALSEAIAAPAARTMPGDAAASGPAARAATAGDRVTAADMQPPNLVQATKDANLPARAPEPVPAAHSGKALGQQEPGPGFSAWDDAAALPGKAHLNQIEKAEASPASGPGASHGPAQEDQKDGGPSLPAVENAVGQPGKAHLNQIEKAAAAADADTWQGPARAGQQDAGSSLPVLDDAAAKPGKAHLNQIEKAETSPTTDVSLSPQPARENKAVGPAAAEPKADTGHAPGNPVGKAVPPGLEADRSHGQGKPEQVAAPPAEAGLAGGSAPEEPALQAPGKPAVLPDPAAPAASPPGRAHRNQDEAATMPSPGGDVADLAQPAESSPASPPSPGVGRAGPPGQQAKLADAAPADPSALDHGRGAADPAQSLSFTMSDLLDPGAASPGGGRPAVLNVSTLDADLRNGAPMPPGLTRGGKDHDLPVMAPDPGPLPDPLLHLGEFHAVPDHPGSAHHAGGDLF